MKHTEVIRQATIATLARGVRKGRRYTDLVYKLHGVTREEVERYAARIVSSDYIRQH